jgi:hypothetical protein
MSWVSLRRTLVVLVAASSCALASVAVEDGRSAPGGVAHEAAAPAICTGPQVRQLVVAFIAAFNSGSKTKLDALWTRVGFRWYSVMRSAKAHYVAYERAKMLRYFAARHTKSEKLVLKSFRFNGVSGDYGHFQYTVTRQANDVAKGAREAYAGKGAAVCIAPGPRLAVWSMARPASATN